MQPVFTELNAIIAGGVVLLLAIVFEALLGLRVIKLKGATHRRVHRILAFVIIGVGLLHGGAAIAGFVFGRWL
jgi:hypothetical protein